MEIWCARYGYIREILLQLLDYKRFTTEKTKQKNEYSNRKNLDYGTGILNGYCTRKISYYKKLNKLKQFLQNYYTSQ